MKQHDKAKNAGDVFRLARNAHAQLMPVFDEIREIEPSASLNIEMTFGGLAYAPADSEPRWTVSVAGHRSKGSMIIFETHIDTLAKVNQAVEITRSRLEALRACGPEGMA